MDEGMTDCCTGVGECIYIQDGSEFILSMIGG